MERSGINTAASDGGLASCLEGARAKEWFVVLLKKSGVETLADFVHMFKKGSYEQELDDFCRTAPEAKSDPVALSRARAAWVAGQAALESLAARPGGADSRADVEDPLPDPTSRELAANWEARYHVQPDMRVDPADLLVARFYREFRRSSPTVVPVEKARSIFAANRPAAERKLDLGQNLRLELEREPEQSVVKVVGYYFGLRIIANAVAKAGNYLVRSATGEGEVTFAPLDVNVNYADECLRRASAWSVDGRVATAWLREKDLLTRGTAVMLMRQGLTQGQALRKAQDECRVEWNTAPRSRAAEPEPRARSRTPRRSRRRRSRAASRLSEPRPTRPAAPAGPSGGGTRSEGKGGGKQRRVTASTAKGGKQICKPFNDDRGCTKQERDCPHKAAHVCDFILPDGTVCGGRHSRRDCRHAR